MSELIDLAGEVALHLGWTLSPKENREDLVYLEKDETIIYLVTDTYDVGPDRVRITGTWPTAVFAGRKEEFRPYHSDYSITCAISRGAKAIAGDIERRMLPDYLAKWREMADYRDKWLARERVIKEASERIASIMGASDFKSPHGDWKIRSPAKSPITGSVKVSGYVSMDRYAERPEETHAEIQLYNITFDQMERIARILWGGNDAED